MIHLLIRLHEGDILTSTAPSKRRIPPKFALACLGQPASLRRQQEGWHAINDWPNWPADRR